MTVGEKIKEKRILLGISQTELANMVNISKQSLYKYENNIITNIPSDKLELIAKKLKVSPAYLMGWDRDIVNMDLTDSEACVINAYREKNNEEKHAIRKYLDIWDNPHPEEEESFEVKIIEITQKYINLDSYGKEMVDTVLEKEYNRCSAMKISKYKHLTPVAAHNDNADDEEQQRLMEQDIDEL